MSPLFSFFLCSHYISFPLFVFNLIFFRFWPLFPLSPSNFSFLLHPFLLSFSTFLTLLSFLPFVPLLSFHLPIFHSCSIPPLPSSFDHSVISPYFCFLNLPVSSCFPPSLPLQGVGGDNGWGTEHIDPPQRGSASPTLCQRPDGHLFQGPLNCCLGHGLSDWHQLTSCPGRTPCCCQCGRLWRQIYRVRLRGPHHQGNKI